MQPFSGAHIGALGEGVLFLLEHHCIAITLYDFFIQPDPYPYVTSSNQANPMETHRTLDGERMKLLQT